MNYKRLKAGSLPGWRPGSTVVELNNHDSRTISHYIMGGNNGFNKYVSKDESGYIANSALSRLMDKVIDEDSTENKEM